MIRRLFLLVTAGALMVALTATAAFAQSNTATLSFEVVTEGEVPENTIFRAAGGPPDGALSAIGLTDSDGDGTYTGSVDLDTGEYRVLIEQGTSGEPERTTIWGPEIITLNEDRTISTSVDFGSEPNGEQPQCLLPEGCPGTSDPDEVFTGTEDSEVLFGTNNNDLIEGLGGHDYLNGLWGDDEILGGQGDDLLVGEAGSDRVEGGEGNDYLVAAYGYWQQAPDAPASPDLLRGGPGHDIIDAADLAGAPDTVECGPGFDVVYAGVEDNVADNCEVVYRYEGY